jgi:hypothetical protein
VIDILINISWADQDFASAIFDLISVPDFLIDLLTEFPGIIRDRSLILIAGLNAHLSIQSFKFFNWISALHRILETDFSIPNPIGYTLYIASNLCFSERSTLKVSSISSIISRVNVILDDFDAESNSDSQEMKCALFLVYKFVKNLSPSQIPAHLDLNLSFKGLISEDEDLVSATIDILSVAITQPFYLKLMHACNLMDRMWTCFRQRGFEIRRRILELCVVMVKEASTNELHDLMRNGCVRILTHGLAFEDSEVLKMVFEVLCIAFKNSREINWNKCFALEEFDDEGGVGLIAEFLELEEFDEELEVYVKAFLNLYEELDDDDL